MKLFSRLRARGFCAFCKTPRRLYVKKHVDLTNVVGSIALAAGMSQVLWGEPEPRGLLIFCLSLALAEVFIYLRWRAGLTCSQCGFDPVVYKRSPAAASAMVAAFFAERRDTPAFLLSRSPLVEVHKKSRVIEARQSAHNAMLARRLPPPPVDGVARDLSVR